MGRIIESAGVHVTMDAFVRDPSVFNSETLTSLFHELAGALDMKILTGPNFIEVPVDPGVLEESQSTGVFADEGGITGMCVISKSHMSLHAWPLQSFFSMDVFSCADFDPEVALGIVRERLGVKTESVHVLNRKKPVMQKPSVYCITNKVNGKRYIGKSIDPTSRWGHHVWMSEHPNHQGHKYLHRAIAKYGPNSFTFHVLEVCPNEEVAFERENYWVGKYHTNDTSKGYNLNTGGMGGCAPSDSTRKKMSERKSGVLNPMFGKSHSPEVRAQLSSRFKGVPQGVARTEAHKEAISLARRGELNNATSLTEIKVREIRELCESGVSRTEVAKRFNITEATVSRIYRRKTWCHVA